MKFANFCAGEVKIAPLAFESRGVRGMATYLETDDLKMIIDPGSALGSRFNLDPHEREYYALYESRERILKMSKEADFLSISHYHFDHFIPNFENRELICSSPEMAERLYTDKVILAKDISEHINASQRKRGYLFRKKNLDFAEEIRVADGLNFERGSTSLRFSDPVYHGPTGTDLGYSLILTVSTPNFVMVHAPDVQGPMDEKSQEYILSQSPDLLIVGGPPTYLRFRIEDRNLEKARENLEELARKVPNLVVDHHLLRTTTYEEFLEPVKKEAFSAGNEVMVASEMVGKEPNLLEARRKELHEEEPVGEEWYKSLKEEGVMGEFGGE